MQKTELVNPRPSAGFKDFPRVGSHSSHSEPNRVPQLGLQAPSIHNTVFHPAANASATYPFFCGRYSNDWQQGFVEGMAMFCNMQNNKSFKDKRGTLTGRHTSHNILATVPVLNFYLTIGSCRPDFVQKFVNKYALNEALIPCEPSDEELLAELRESDEKLNGPRGENPISLQDYTREEIQQMKDERFILDFRCKYRFLGVVLTDMDTSSNYQKLFNLVVRGRSRIFNMWTTRLDSKLAKGGQARDRVLKNDKLYFVLKKVKRDELTYKQPDGASMALTPPTRDDGMVWQVKCARLSLRQKPATYDENGHQQHYMYVGQVLNAVSKKPDEHYVRRSFREHTQQSCLPMIEVAVRTGQY